MAAHVAVAGRMCALVGRLVLEDLKQRLAAEPEEMNAGYHRPVVDAKVFAHPVAVVLVGAECVQVLASEHVHQELAGLVEAGNGDADVVQPGQPDDWHGSSNGSILL